MKCGEWAMGAWYYLLTKIHSQPDSACTSAKHTLGTTHRTRRPGLKCVPQIFNASLAIPDQTHNFFFHGSQATELGCVLGIFSLFPLNGIPVRATRMSSGAWLQPFPMESFSLGLVVLGIWRVINPVDYNERHASHHKDDSSHQEDQSLRCRGSTLGSRDREQRGLL